MNLHTIIVIIILISEKFLQTVQALNEEAEIKITNNNPNEALPFLIQA